MSDFTRNAFRIQVTLQEQHDVSSSIAVTATDMPSDYVIQISLKKDDFKQLFQSPGMNKDTPYSAPDLLARLNTFWQASWENHNTFANSVYSLISNEYDDIDINPINLKLATMSDYTETGENSEIFDYFHLEKTTINAEDKDDNGNDVPLKVYEAMAAELNTLLSKIPGSDSNEDPFESLEHEYGYEKFWNELQAGDSIFIEGSFNVPTEHDTSKWNDGRASDNLYNPVGKDQGANLPCILRFMVVDDAEADYSWEAQA